MKTDIGADEARTRLPELLRQVKAGKHFTIIYRGVAVADLVPSGRLKPKNKAAAVEVFMAFMRENPVRGAINIKEFIEKGRA